MSITFEVETTTGNYDLKAAIRWIGDDLMVNLWGGEKPHIGAVSVAQPRPSLKDPQQISASASVICLLGHKEDELARAAALKIAQAMNANTVVTAGMHWDDLSPEGIQQVLKNSVALIDLILLHLQQALQDEVQP